MSIQRREESDKQWVSFALLQRWMVLLGERESALWSSPSLHLKPLFKDNDSVPS